MSRGRDDHASAAVYPRTGGQPASATGGDGAFAYNPVPVVTAAFAPTFTTGPAFGHSRLRSPGVSHAQRDPWWGAAEAASAARGYATASTRASASFAAANTRLRLHQNR